MVCCPDLFWFPCAVDIGFPKGRCHTDGKLLQCAAVAAHGVPFEVGEYQHGIIVCKMLAYIVFLNLFALRDFQHHIRVFCVHQVYFEVGIPSVTSQQRFVLFSGVPFAFISGIAFYNGAAYKVDDRLPEIRFQEILITFFTGVKLDGNIASEFFASHFI